jgi:hypothetical protein
MAVPAHANHNSRIDPTRDQVRSLRDHGRDGPVVMMNLLKFRETADYPPEAPSPWRSARSARPK